GPSAMRYAGAVERLEALNYTVRDLGDIPIGQPDFCGSREQHNLLNLDQVADGNVTLAKMIDKEMKDKKFPLILGGDHSIAIGSLAGVSRHYDNLGVIWYDAHGDLNTAETSPSGNIHGMPLAASLGYGDEKLTSILGYQPKVKPENIVIIG